MLARQNCASGRDQPPALRWVWRPSSGTWRVTHGAFKEVSEQGGDGSSPKNALLLTKRGDEAVPASFLTAPWCVTTLAHVEFALGYEETHKRWISRGRFNHETPGSVVLLRGGRLLAVDGQPDFEAGFAWPGFKFNFTSVTVADNAIADDQAKTGANAGRFCREKWLEHF